MSAASASAAGSLGARPAAGALDIRTNGWLAILLIGLLAVVPLPLGGNRPVAVAATGLCVFGIGTWYGLRLGWRRHALRIGFAELWLPALLFAGFLAVVVVQILPLGPFVRTLPGVQVTSSTLSLAPGASAVLALQFAAYGVFALLIMQVAARERRSVAALDWIFGLIAGYAALGLLMFLQMGDTFFGIEKAYYQGSLTGTFVNRNSNATFLAFGLATGCAMLAESVAPHARRFSLRPLVIAGGLVLIGIALLATNSRMGIVAGLAGGAVALLTGAIKARFSWWQWGGLLALLIAAAVCLAPEYGAVALDRFLDLDASLGSRVELYGQVGAMIGADPLLGYGGGSFEWVFPLFHQPPLSSDVVWDRAHSTYLGLWADYGPTAGTIPPLVVAIFAVRAAVAFGAVETGWAVPLAAIAVVTVAGLHSIVDFSLEMPANAFFLLAVAGMGAASKTWAARGRGTR